MITLSEAIVLRSGQLTATACGARLLRNNVGVAELKDGRRIRFGLGVGSSDLVGWSPYLVTAQDVGAILAVFTACEAKAESGRVTNEQEAFIQAVLHAGGRAGVFRCDDDLRSIVTRQPGLPRP